MRNKKGQFVKGTRASIKTEFKKGCTPLNKGEKRNAEVVKKGVQTRKNNGSYVVSDERKQKMRERKEEDHPSWRGDKVGYVGLHTWIKKKLGTPKYCEHCKRTDRKKYEWASIDHKYLRDIKEWKRLCTSCHWLFDIKFNNKKSNYHKK